MLSQSFSASSGGVVRDEIQKSKGSCSPSEAVLLLWPLSSWVSHRSTVMFLFPPPTMLLIGGTVHGYGT